MNRFITTVVTLLGLLLVATPAAAKDIPVTIRDSSEARAVAMCAVAREVWGGPGALPGTWTLEQCFTTVVARAMQTLELRAAMQTAQATTDALKRDTVVAAKERFTDDGKKLVVATPPPPAQEPR